MMIAATLLVLVWVNLLVTVVTFRVSPKFTTSSRSIFPLFDSDANANDIGNERVDGFDPGEFDQIFKVLSPGLNKNKINKMDNEILSELQEATKKEELFRKYPFDSYELPVLPDCNNYYSGKFEDSFWLQNSDQVFVYIPIPESVSSKDITVKFEVKRVDINIKGEEKVVFCSERIIPDGSFWTMEADKDGTRYLQLDLEKR
jgi:hypothetical protein